MVRQKSRDKLGSQGVRHASPFAAEHFKHKSMLKPVRKDWFVLVWVWVKTRSPGDRRFSSLFPFTRVPFWVPILDPHPMAMLGQNPNRTPQ